MLLKSYITHIMVPAFLVVASLGCALAPAARAVPPMPVNPAPGFYRMKLGNFEVIALSDGSFNMPADKLLRGISPAAVDKALAAHGQSSPVKTSVNAFLVNTGSKLVLIDTGAGDFFGPTVGRVLASLKAAGYRPGQVDDILITHMHPDHVGGLSSNGHMNFPHATVWVNRKDADYWLDPAQMAKAPEGARGTFKDAMAAFKPYQAAGHVRTFTGKKRILPGIRTLPEPGHTPGHSGYLVSSKGHVMLAWGDIIHVQAVQFADPSVTITYDSDPAQARATRMKVLAMVAARKILVAGAHLAFPGLGHVRKAGHGYAWVPVKPATSH